ncbi:hypothetical protein LXL04_008181 [Taraxacum kok-saghyz]
MHPNSIEWTAFTSPEGHFEWLAKQLILVGSQWDLGGIPDLGPLENPGSYPGPHIPGLAVKFRKLGVGLLYQRDAHPPPTCVLLRRQQKLNRCHLISSDDYEIFKGDRGRGIATGRERLDREEDGG